VALAALDAVLAQALALDGGRYLTPYGFVRALKRQPLSFVAPQQADAVQLLTVHGAKGLEARVVFIVDSDAAPARADTHTLLVEWPVDAAHPSCCAFVKSETKPPPSLAQAMAFEREMRQREELNGLYVAITRAREQLVFSRLEPHRRGEQATWWQRAEAAGGLGGDAVWQVATGDGVQLGGVSHVDADGAGLVRLPATPGFVDRALPLQASSSGTAVAQPDSDSREAQLGRAVHRVLEWLTTRPLAQRAAALAGAARVAAGEFGLGAGDAPAVEQLASRVLFAPGLQPWLDPAALAWAGNEVELVDAGDVLRLDRLVARPADASGQVLEWWVLDYKLQHHPQELPAYREQLGRYQRAVQALQPGEVVRAAFISGAGELIEQTDEPR
jgi:ATP-dependent helicase/nuclease subunit A